ncbi:unnamed protein product [Parajaminaea phylloscopi]
MATAASSSSGSTTFRIVSKPSPSAAPSSALRPASHYVHLSGHQPSLGSEDDEDLEGGADYSTGTVIATPGQSLGSLSTYMRGHGTHIVSSTQEITSSLAGRVLLTNRLVSLQPFHTRYTPETGDLVLGRVLSVLPGARRWKIDLSAASFANLALSAINLPGGIQRRKLASDELQMRQFFKEGDLLVAEVQGVFGDGTTSLHTRSLRYGKLRNGRLARVPPRLVKRGKSHFIRLEQDGQTVEMILGLNGWIWLSGVGAMQGSSISQANGPAGAGAAADDSASAAPTEPETEGLGGKGVGRDIDAGGTYSDDLKLPPPQTLDTLSLLCTLLSLLAKAYLPVSDLSVQAAWAVAAARLRSAKGRTAAAQQDQQQWWRGTMKKIKAEFLARGILTLEGTGGVRVSDAVLQSDDEDEDAEMDDL